MKAFTNFIKKCKADKRVRFAGTVLVFYGLMLILYVYLMNANLSTAPKFIYSQF